MSDAALAKVKGSGAGAKKRRKRFKETGIFKTGYKNRYSR